MFEPKTINNDIDAFFNALYNQSPTISKDRNSTVYSILEKGISIIQDPYGGCHIDIKSISFDQYTAVQNAIHKFSEAMQESKAFDSIWVDIALPTSALAIIPPSFQIGETGKSDLIYDYQQKKIKIWRWLNNEKECAIPAGATHNIGATALILDNISKKVLLVENVRRQGSWNLPGGSFDPIKDNAPCFTALREAQEEGGFEINKNLKIEPKLMGQMQFPYNQFAPAINQIWAYSIDNVSESPLTPPADEIKQAVWVSFDEIVNNNEGALRNLNLSDEIRLPLIAAINQQGFEKILDKNWMIVHTSVSKL